MFQTERRIYRYLESVSDVFPMPFRCLSDVFPLLITWYGSCISMYIMSSSRHRKGIGKASGSFWWVPQTMGVWGAPTYPTSETHRKHIGRKLPNQRHQQVSLQIISSFWVCWLNLHYWFINLQGFHKIPCSSMKPFGVPGAASSTSCWAWQGTQNPPAHASTSWWVLRVVGWCWVWDV